MVSISADIGEIDIQLNPYRLGELFAEMDSQEQMRFLNGFSCSVNNKGYGCWPMQCRSILKEFKINDFNVMRRQAADALETLIEHLRDETNDTK